MQLNPQEWDRYVVLAGNEAKAPNGLGCKDALEKLVGSSEYKKQSEGPEGGRALLIRRTIDAYRELARSHMVKEFPDLGPLIEEVARRKGEALRPQY